MSYLDMARKAAAARTQAPTVEPMESAAPRLTRELIEDFAAHGAVTEIRVPGIPETLFMAPTLDDARRLMVWEGVSRGRIWTAAELADVVTIPNRTPETWAAIAIAKITFDGDVVEIRQRERAA